MGILGRPQGVFEIADSDNAVGSFLTKEDICTLLKVTESDLTALNFKTIDGFEIVDERQLQQAYYKDKIPNAYRDAKTSVDELLLRAIIKDTYPECVVERQVRVKRYSMDLKLTFNDKTVFVEFDGPSHFAQSRWGLPKDPAIKKNIVEQETGIEVINWPYWIQRCSLNVQAIFNPDIQGLGALWSTNVHFGMFIFSNSADIIEKMTKRFNAVDDSGFGYFYGPNTRDRNNPEHPIIEQIVTGKSDKETLLPKGFKDEGYWLPDRLRK